MFIYRRIYQKLTDYLADMTSLLSQGILLIMFVVTYLNEKAAYQKVIDSYMKYKDSTRYSLKKMIKKFKEAFEKEDKDRKSVDEIRSDQILVKIEECPKIREENCILTSSPQGNIYFI